MSRAAPRIRNEASESECDESEYVTECEAELPETEGLASDSQSRRGRNSVRGERAEHSKHGSRVSGRTRRNAPDQTCGNASDRPRSNVGTVEGGSDASEAGYETEASLGGFVPQPPPLPRLAFATSVVGKIVTIKDGKVKVDDVERTVPDVTCTLQMWLGTWCAQAGARQIQLTARGRS